MVSGTWWMNKMRRSLNHIYTTHFKIKIPNLFIFSKLFLLQNPKIQKQMKMEWCRNKMQRSLNHILSKIQKQIKMERNPKSALVSTKKYLQSLQKKNRSSLSLHICAVMGLIDICVDPDQMANKYGPQKI
jgi:hypothetical protein